MSWHIKDRTKEFYIWLLILAAATIGVFMSLDLFFLYFFYEMSVIPMYLLLGMWGSHTKKYLEMTDPAGLKQRDSVGFIFNFGANSKEYAAMKLVLFLSAFAVVALMGILLIYKFSGLNTFDILILREQAHFSGSTRNDYLVVDLLRICVDRSDLAFAFLVSGRPCGRAGGDQHVACRRADEARTLLDHSSGIRNSARNHA